MPSPPDTLFVASWMGQTQTKLRRKPLTISKPQITALPSHLNNLPPRFADLKKEILTDEGAVVKAWNEILAELKIVISEWDRIGSDVGMLY